MARQVWYPTNDRRVLSIEEVYVAARQAGFDDKGARIITAIAGAESGRSPGKFSGPNSDGTIDRGLLQMNSIHKAIDDKCALDVACSMSNAYSMSRKGTSFRDWATYPAPALGLLGAVNTAIAGKDLTEAIKNKGVVGAVVGGVADVAGEVQIPDPTGIIGFGRTLVHGVQWLSNMHNLLRVLEVVVGVLALVVGIYVIVEDTKPVVALREGAVKAAELAAVA